MESKDRLLNEPHFCENEEALKSLESKNTMESNTDAQNLEKSHSDSSSFYQTSNDIEAVSPIVTQEVEVTKVRETLPLLNNDRSSSQTTDIDALYSESSIQTQKVEDSKLDDTHPVSCVKDSLSEIHDIGNLCSLPSFSTQKVVYSELDDNYAVSNVKQLPNQTICDTGDLSYISNKQIEASKAGDVNPISNVKQLSGQRIQNKETLCSVSYVPSQKVEDSELNDTGISISDLYFKDHKISDMQLIPNHERSDQSNDIQISCSVISTSSQQLGVSIISKVEAMSEIDGVFDHTTNDIKILSKDHSVSSISFKQSDKMNTNVLQTMSNVEETTHDTNTPCSIISIPGRQFNTNMQHTPNDREFCDHASDDSEALCEGGMFSISPQHLKTCEIDYEQPIQNQEVSSDKVVHSIEPLFSTSAQRLGNNKSNIQPIPDLERPFDKTNEIETTCTITSIPAQSLEEPLIDSIQSMPKVDVLFGQSAHDKVATIQEKSDTVSSRAIDTIRIVHTTSGLYLGESDIKNCKSKVTIDKEYNDLNSEIPVNIGKSRSSHIKHFKEFNSESLEFSPIIEGSLSLQGKKVSVLNLYESNPFKIQPTPIKTNIQNNQVASSSKSSNSAQFIIDYNASDDKSNKIINVETSDGPKLRNNDNAENKTSLFTTFEGPATDIKPSLNALNVQIEESSVSKLPTFTKNLIDSNNDGIKPMPSVERSDVLKSQNKKKVHFLSPQCIRVSNADVELTQKGNDGPGTSHSSAALQITETACSRTCNNPFHKEECDSDIKPLFNLDGSIILDPPISQATEKLSNKSSISAVYLEDYDTNDIKPILNLDGSVAFDPQSSLATMEAASSEPPLPLLPAVVEGTEFKPILNGDRSIFFDPMEPTIKDSSIFDLSVKKHNTGDTKPTLNLNGSVAFETQSTDVSHSIESNIDTNNRKLNDDRSDLFHRSDMHQALDTEQINLPSIINPEYSSSSFFPIPNECEKPNIPLTSDIEECKPCINSVTSSDNVGCHNNTDVEKSNVTGLEYFPVQQDKSLLNSENISKPGFSNLKEIVAQPTLSKGQRKRLRKKTKRILEKAQLASTQNENSLKNLVNSEIRSVESSGNVPVATNTPLSNTFNIAVFPVDYPHSILPFEKFRELKVAFLKKIDTLKLTEKISPKYAGIKYENGGCLINCLDLATESWTAKTVKELRLKNLRLVTGKPEILTHTKIVGFFRGPILKPEQFIHRLIIQNLEMKSIISEWKPLILKEMPSGFYSVLEVRNCHVKYLKYRSSLVNYYLGSVKLVDPPAGVNLMEPDESWASWCPLENTADISIVDVDSYYFSELKINNNEVSERFSVERTREKHHPEKERVGMGGKVRRREGDTRIGRRKERGIKWRIDGEQERRYEENRKRRFDDRKFEEIRRDKSCDEVRKERRIQEERRMEEVKREKTENLDKQSAIVFYKKVQRWKESGINEEKKNICSSGKGSGRCQKIGEIKESEVDLIDSQCKYDGKNVVQERIELGLVQNPYKTSTEAKLTSDSLLRDMHWWVEESSDEEKSRLDVSQDATIWGHEHSGDQLYTSRGVDHLRYKNSKERKRLLNSLEDSFSSDENSLDYKTTFCKKQKICDLSNRLSNLGKGKNLTYKPSDTGRSVWANLEPVRKLANEVSLVDSTTVIKTVRASAFFPADNSGTYVSTQVILTRLRRQNIAAAIEKWSMTELLREKSGVYVRICIPDTSLPALQAREFRLYYNLGRVPILLASDKK